MQFVRGERHPVRHLTVSIRLQLSAQKTLPSRTPQTLQFSLLLGGKLPLGQVNGQN